MPDGKLTYAELFAAARRVLTEFRRRGWGPGSRVALTTDRPRSFLTSFWACVLGGYLPCPVPVGYLAQVREVLGDAHVFDDPHDLRAEDGNQDTREANPRLPALLMPMLGARPLIAMLTHCNVVASISAKADRLALDDSDVTLNWMTFEHGSALVENHLLPMSVGADQLHVPTSEIMAAPVRLLELVDRHRVSMTFARNSQLAAIKATLPVSNRLDLSCLRHLVTGGEPLSVVTGREFLDRLAPYGLGRDVLRPALGRPETCAAATYSHTFPGDDIGHEVASLGTPLSGLDMRITDRGELALRGPMISVGYFNDPAATRAAFTSDGWFDTGMPALIENGRLRLIRRAA